MMKEIEPGSDEKLFYLDICSLYPFVQKTKRFPTGHPRTIKHNFGIAHCTILPPQDLLFPVLPVRSRGKLIFPLCQTCCDWNQISICKHTDSQRQLEGEWTTIEIYEAMRQGYKLVRFNELWDFETSIQYDPLSTEPLTHSLSRLHQHDVEGQDGSIRFS